MDLTFLAETAKDAPFISESILKFICGGMATAIVGMAISIKKLYDDKSKITDSLPEKMKQQENELREKWQAIVDKLTERYDEEKKELKKDVSRLTQERFILLQEQIQDMKNEGKGLESLSEDYETLLAKTIGPVLKENVSLLKYYRKRRETNG